MRIFKAPLWISLSLLFLSAAAFLALDYYSTQRSIALERSTGLGAVAGGIFFEPRAMWGQSSARMLSSPGAVMATPAIPAEEYAGMGETGFVDTAQELLSTFSIDVDTASYTNIRRFLNDGRRPPAAAVRIEEMLNYFSYAYPDPTGAHPFSITTEVATCPWDPAHRLMRVGLKSKPIATRDLPPARLAFLIDVSGSMNDPAKLPLVKRSFALLVEQLRPEDSVAIAVYAGSAGLVLPPTHGSQKAVIQDAIDRLEAGGSTAGGEGIQLAYATARTMFRQDANNRVILATDGDFNVGVSSDEELVRLIESERDHGVFLTVLGFGTGNLKDAKLEKLADHGNGHYAYLDSILEARRVFVEQLGGTLQTVAKDVKIQVEFNPARVRSYRLVGYENRKLTAEEFRDDRKDAGDLGAGHMVTALYELIPNGVQPLSEDSFLFRLRYKPPQANQSLEWTVPALAETVNPSPDWKWAAAVAQFGMLLVDSEHKGKSSFASTLTLAESAVHGDVQRAEFVTLVRKAAEIPATPPNR